MNQRWMSRYDFGAVSAPHCSHITRRPPHCPHITQKPPSLPTHHTSPRTAHTSQKPPSQPTHHTKAPSLPHRTRATKRPGTRNDCWMVSPLSPFHSIARYLPLSLAHSPTLSRDAGSADELRDRVGGGCWRAVPVFTVT